MKKTNVFLFAVLFSILCFQSLMINAQIATVKLNKLNASPDETVLMPVEVTNFVNVGAITLYIQFDPSVLQFVEALNWDSQMLSGGPDAFANAGMLVVIGDNINGINISSGKLVDLKFIYKGGVGALTFTSECEIVDSEANTIVVNYSGGVIEPPIIITTNAEPENICISQSSQLNADVEGGFGAYTYSWSSVPEGFSSFEKNPIVSPDITTTYTVLVNDGYFEASASIIVTVNLTGCGNKISGTLVYENSVKTPLNGITINLKNPENSIVGTGITDINGIYEIPNIENGTYTLEIIMTKSHGGINPTDALLTNRNYIMTYDFTNPLLQKAANVNADKTINPTDALLILKRYNGSIEIFKAGDWIYDKENVVVNGADVVLDIKAVCVGDVNGSYKP